MPLPRQSQYVIVSWSNGPSSVHRDRESALLHIRRLRGEDGNHPTRSRDPQAWKAAVARVITVTAQQEELI